MHEMFVEPSKALRRYYHPEGGHNQVALDFCHGAYRAYVRSGIKWPNSIFKYGAMGSSKSAQALITQFNYEELGMTVWLIKPSVDDRDRANIIRSRIGLQREAQVIHPDEDHRNVLPAPGTPMSSSPTRRSFLPGRSTSCAASSSTKQNIPVLCFGLRTDFLALFPRRAAAHGLADSITEIKTVCLRPARRPSTPASTSAAASSPRRADPARRQRQLRRHVPKCWVDKIRAQRKRRKMNRRASHP